MKTSVEVSIAGFTDESVLLCATDLYGQVVEPSISFEDLFARKDLRPTSVIYPIRVDTHPPFSTMRAEVAALLDLNKEFEQLRSECASTTDSSRYELMTQHDGLTDVVISKMKVKTLMLKVMFCASMGVWPQQFVKSLY